MAPVRWHEKPFAALSARELYAILALRAEVFVVEQRCAYLDPDGADPEARHLFAEDAQGALVAYARLFAPGVKYTEAAIGRVVTAPRVRGAGFGRALIARALEAIERADGEVDVHLSAQAHLERFYGSFGFVRVGEPYLEDAIPHVGMTRRRAER
jgi:ElaA protein